MHSVFDVIGRLKRIDTGLCYGGGTDIFKDGVIFIDDHINVIGTNCFDEYYIGPSCPIIFKNIVFLEPYSITSPLITEIVFMVDANLSPRAFYSKTVNSDLNKNYILYGPKDSNVEKYAKKHGFVFRTLDNFVKPNNNKPQCWICDYDSNIIITKDDYCLTVNEDRFIFYKKAKERNGDYIFVQSPYAEDSFKKEVKVFINEFMNCSTSIQRERYCWKPSRQVFLTISLNEKDTEKFLTTLLKAFKGTDVENYLSYLED